MSFALTPEALTAAQPGGAPKGDAHVPSTPEGQAANQGGEGTLSSPAKKPEEDMSAKFAALSRKERKVFEESKRAKEIEGKYAPLEKLIANAKNNPLEMLKAAGLTLEDVIQYQLKQGVPPTVEDQVKTLEERIKEFEERQKADADRVKQESIQREVSAFREAMTTHLGSDTGKYELIHANDASEMVFDACLEAIRANPDDYPTRKEAEALIPRVADLIEDELFERAKKFQSVSKFKALFGTPTQAEGEAQAAPHAFKDSTPPAQAISKPDTTITNRAAASGSPAPQPPGRTLSREESLKRAAAFLDAELKKKKQG